MAIDFNDVMIEPLEGPAVILVSGVPGVTPVLSVGTVETVSADASAEVTMEGNPTNPRLNFKIPRGVAGYEAINDSADEGDTDYVWSADKSFKEVEDAKNPLSQIYFTSFTPGSNNSSISNYVYPNGREYYLVTTNANISGAIFYYDQSLTQIGSEEIMPNGMTFLNIPENTNCFVFRAVPIDGNAFTSDYLKEHAYILMSFPWYDDLKAYDPFPVKELFWKFSAGSGNYRNSNFVNIVEGYEHFLFTNDYDAAVYYYDESSTLLGSVSVPANVFKLDPPSGTTMFLLRAKAKSGDQLSESVLKNSCYVLRYSMTAAKLLAMETLTKEEVSFTSFNAGSGNYGISNYVYPEREKTYYIRSGLTEGSVFAYDYADTQIARIDIGPYCEKIIDLPDNTYRFVYRAHAIDGSAFSEAFLLANSCVLTADNLVSRFDENIGAYLLKDDIKHRIVVDANGHGDFTTIHEAWDSIKDSSYYNQYEICVMPGEYSENNITPPPYTHTHGIVPKSVHITSYGGDTTLSVIDVKSPCKLSNLKITSYTKYVIHYDSGANTGGIFVGENLELIQTRTANNMVIGGGTYKNGTEYYWKSCIFLNGSIHCHTSGEFTDYDNTHVHFINCKTGYYGYYIQSTGGYGQCVYEIIGTKFNTAGTQIEINVNNQRNIDEPWTFLAEPNEWQVVGHSNENVRVTFSGQTGECLMFETKNNNESIAVSGTAVKDIFGIVKYKQGGTRLTGKAYGIYLVKDAQTSGGSDVFQLWKRLGDCSGTSKTLSVTVGGVTKTYTFDQNYLSSQPSENTIIAAVNAVITNAVLKKKVITEFWSGIELEEKQYITVTSDCITKGSAIDEDGAYCEANTTSLYGIALEDGIQGETIPVWTGNYLNVDLPDGEYGIGSYGVLDASASNKVATVSDGILKISRY